MNSTNQVVTTEGDRETLSSFARLMFWISIFTLGVIIFGSAVRATDSGMGCPDWPLCHDQLVPAAFDSQVFYEWFHRLIGGVLAVLFGIAMVRVWRQPVLRKTFGTQLVAGALLLLIQIVLGGLTVLQLLDPKIVSAHLVNATLFYGLLVWTAVKAWALSRSQPRRALPGRLQTAALVFLGLVFVQIFLGGMVSSNYAGLSCLQFPQCGDEWWPVGDFASHLHMIHRAMAGFVFLASLLMLVAGRIMNRAKVLSPFAAVSLWLVPLLIVIQIALGIVNVLWQLPDWASVLHLAVAQLIFSAALISTVLIRLHGRSLPEPMVDTDRHRQTLADPSFVAGT